MHRKRPELWPTHRILLNNNASAHKTPSVKQLLAQKSITIMEHPPYSPNLVLNDFWLFLKEKSTLKGTKFSEC